MAIHVESSRTGCVCAGGVSACLRGSARPKLVEGSFAQIHLLKQSAAEEGKASNSSLPKSIFVVRGSLLRFSPCGP